MQLLARAVRTIFSFKELLLTGLVLFFYDTTTWDMLRSFERF